MKRLNKKGIIITAALISTLVMGGTVYGLSHSKQVQETKTALAQEEETLTNLSTQLENFQLENGYLSTGISQDKLHEIKNLLNHLKVSSSDYQIMTDKMKGSIEDIKADKSNLLDSLRSIEFRLESQDELNKFFEKEVLVGKEVRNQVIQKGVTIEKIENFKSDYLNGLEDDKWVEDVIKIIGNAKSQVKKIESATKEVNELFGNNKEVKDSVNRDKYKEVKDSIGKVQNKEVKEELESKLEGVLKEIEKREKVAEEEARKQQEVDGKNSNVSNGGSLPPSSNSGGSSSGSDSGSSSSNSSANADSSRSKSTGSTSQSSDSSSSSSNGNSSSSSGPSNPNVGTNVKKTGEGCIDPNETFDSSKKYTDGGGPCNGGNWWEGGTFDLPENYCKDFGC